MCTRLCALRAAGVARDCHGELEEVRRARVEEHQVADIVELCEREGDRLPGLI